MASNDENTIFLRMTITTLDDGEVFFSNESDDEQAIPIQVGSGQIFPKIDQALQSMKIGDRKSIELTASEAFGLRSEQNIQEVLLEQIPEEIRKVGESLIAEIADGQEIPGIICEIKNDIALVDFNHPLSGRDLKVDFTVTEN